MKSPMKFPWPRRRDRLHSQGSGSDALPAAVRGPEINWHGRLWMLQGDRRLRFSRRVGERGDLWPAMFWIDLPSPVSEIVRAGPSLFLRAAGATPSFEVVGDEPFNFVLLDRRG